MDFVVDPEVKALLDPLSKEEYTLLDRAIWNDRRVRDKLIIGVVEDQRILADGHNRLEIATRHDLPYDTEDRYFTNRNELYQWVIDNQLGRRNLTDERRAYYIGKEYQLAKQEHGGKRSSCQNDNLKTAEKMAEKHNVSEATILRSAKFAKAVDTLPFPAKEQVLSGQSGLTKSQVINLVKVCPTCAALPAPVQGCQQCRELRMSREPGADDRGINGQVARPRVGQVLFDWHALDKSLGTVMRWPNQVKAAYPNEERSEEYRRAVALLGELAELRKSWQQRLVKG